MAKVMDTKSLKQCITERLVRGGMRIEQISGKGRQIAADKSALVRPDVLVLDLSAMGQVGGARTSLQVPAKARDMVTNGVPMIVLTSSNTQKLASLRPLLKSGLTDFVRLPSLGNEIDQDAIEEVFERAQLLVERGRQRAEISRPLQIVPQLHNEQSGRLDAQLLAQFFAVPMSTLARVIGTNRAALHKTPDAPSIQSKLQIWQFVASALLSLVDTQEAARIWLNTSNPELEDQIPLKLMKAGEADIVADLLRDVLTGQPA